MVGSNISFSHIIAAVDRSVCYDGTLFSKELIFALTLKLGDSFHLRIVIAVYRLYTTSERRGTNLEFDHIAKSLWHIIHVDSQHLKGKL